MDTYPLHDVLGEVLLEEGSETNWSHILPTMSWRSALLHSGFVSPEKKIGKKLLLQSTLNWMRAFFLCKDSSAVAWKPSEI